MTNSIADIASADCIFVIGSNTTENHPVIALKVKEAVRRGARLIVADPRRIELVNFSYLWLRQKPGTDLALLNGLLHVIIKEELYDKEFIAQRTEGFEALKLAVEEYTPAKVSEVTGVPAGDIIEAARTYARGPRSTILYAMGITQHITGTANVMALANLAMACGQVGKEGSGVNPLRGQSNVQGACDMGGLPNVLPGYQPVTDPGVRHKFSEAWGVPDLPGEPGLTLMEMMAAAQEGKLKGMYILGENPVLTDPDVSHVKEALKNLEFLVVQDIFLTETARMADVVLPGASFAEKEGTFTSTERRVQLLHKAIEPPGEARPDWLILNDLLLLMGYPRKYSSPGEIMQEIAGLTPSYAGITYERLEDKGLQWPVLSLEHPGTPVLHREKFSRGYGQFQVVHYRPPAEEPDEEYPFLFTTGRNLYHYHTVISRKSRGLEEMCPAPVVEINDNDAARLGIREGEMIEIVSRRGKVRVKALVTDRIPRGQVFMNFHFHEAAANLLTIAALDPVAKIPEYKTCAVAIKVKK
ncbi:Formate dehydrogenase H [Moorella thermoacetica]|nr:Formate dehydrogenase H [Moorella thermoacetica]GAF25549.1 formate dehydrogenase alpha subunit [Moorella thermoacetica Y72]OIQ09971.1 formate dehydrogenase H [Moorella thermoacetica]OIQ12281.1 formate dehydrogenase H [Moorella thermoacetica]OIQ52886.1 formate dehydrogenase H [Moorella thermoacetica]